MGLGLCCLLFLCHTLGSTCVMFLLGSARVKSVRFGDSKVHSNMNKYARQNVVWSKVQKLVRSTSTSDVVLGNRQCITLGNSE